MKSITNVIYWTFIEMARFTFALFVVGAAQIWNHDTKRDIFPEASNDNCSQLIMQTCQSQGLV